MKKRITYFIILLLSFLIIITNLFLWEEEILSAFKKEEPQYHILVDVEEPRMYILKDGICIAEYTCSGGKPSTPSPIGTWTIISKDTWGEGFGGRWMGFNVPWGNFGIHGTTEMYSVGWNSSHGCIRMNNDEVAEIYKYIPIGTKVTIVDGVYGAFGKGFRNLKSGMYGSDVMKIQKRLKELGFFTSNPNGKFGAETEKAVQAYCRANNLYIRKTIDVELQKHMGFELID
mgnify:FL=1